MKKSKDLEEFLFTVYVYVDEKNGIQCWSDIEEEFEEDTEIYYLGRVKATLIKQELPPDLLQRLLTAQSSYDKLPNVGEFGYLQNKALVGIVKWNH